MHVAFKIFLDEFFFDLKFGAVLLRDRRCIGHTVVARLLEKIDYACIFESFTNCPESKNKRETGQESPALGQVEHLQRLGAQTKQRLLAGGLRTLVVFREFQGAVANQQGGIALAKHVGKVRIRRSKVGMSVVKIVENDPGKSDRCS